MKHFLDTSTLIAAFLETDNRHAECRALLLRMRPESAACAAHSLAEFYSVLTRLPAPLRLRPEQAGLLLEDVYQRLTPVALTATEYLREIRNITQSQIPGGQVYDALILAAARKCDAGRIYTVNLRHFQSLAPDLASRITTP